MSYAIGLDYGTNSVRALLVDTADGSELATAVYDYEHGENGILLDGSNHNLARQSPADYLTGLERTVRQCLDSAVRADPGFDPKQVIGLGVDTTGSTPIPVDQQGRPLAFHPKYQDHLAAQAWLWKDHTAHAEAAEITELARRRRPEYLNVCGGTYSSEWFFSKILHCLRSAPEVFEAAHTWVEHADWLPAVLTGTENPQVLRRNRCAAGHKAMFSDQWGGYPDREFLTQLDARLGNLSGTLPKQTFAIDEPAGGLTEMWADKLGLPAGIPVAMGAFDAHLGAVGSGIAPGVMVKILGTSSCDLVVRDNHGPQPEIPGICGVVDGSVLPGHYGLEAGQSAVGDIFNWLVNYIQPGGPQSGGHAALTAKAEKLKPGQSGLLALDWNNGNRTVLVDQRLTGLLVGQTLHTRPEEIYRALVEATAFGALTIVNRFEEYGVATEKIVSCGGISEKNEMLMQIYADVTGREMLVSKSAQTCALGAAIAGAVAGGAFPDFHVAQQAMTGYKSKVFRPIPANQGVYRRLFALYQQLHDAFGIAGADENLSQVMKELLKIKDENRG